MWQVWQVGAAASAGRTCFCFSSLRTPCLEAEYISHWGWSKPMWQVSQACGERASSTEKVWRVWQASHWAAPNSVPEPFWRSSTSSIRDLSPILWHPPQPFSPSVMAIGCQWMVGMAFIAAQATACLPFLNCATCVSWHWAQVSGVGIFTLATSLAEECWSPWQATQVISAALCLLSFQSETMLGVTFVWQSMHCAAVVWADREFSRRIVRRRYGKIRESRDGIDASRKPGIVVDEV